MHKIIWAPSALDDIELIAQFIERDSPDQASLFVSRVIEMTDQLERFPLSGRVIPEMSNANCRELIYGAYRIMYRVTNLKSGSWELFTAPVTGLAALREESDGWR